MMAVDQIARMMALDAAQSGGGGGGTSNYNQLTNKPSINGVTLTGNKTTSDLGIVENVQANWNETDSTAPSYIQNKPNIPSGVVVDTTYDGTSENAQAGTAVAQAVSTKVDKVTGKGLSENDYTNADKAKLDGIETGAEANVQADWAQTDSTADDYIKNKPTIQTVNDATLTIQKNGTAVGTFSANAATAATINITVPVDAAGVDALPDTTKYGASLALSIDSSTYVVTATLKDQDGNTLGTAQTIDLPLETVVVGGSYDDTTKKVILTLKNGNTIDFSVADLVAGLQTEITSTNKLDADLVDDTTSSHKFVTAADKAAWNAKSDFSGDYDDLTNKPTIPAAQVNADWNATSGVAQILNKPTIPAAVTVDQTYNAQSANAQSGTAVKQAMDTVPDTVKSQVIPQGYAAITHVDNETTGANLNLSAQPIMVFDGQTLRTTTTVAGLSNIDINPNTSIVFVEPFPNTMAQISNGLRIAYSKSDYPASGYTMSAGFYDAPSTPLSVFDTDYYTEVWSQPVEQSSTEVTKYLGLAKQWWSSTDRNRFVTIRFLADFSQMFFTCDLSGAFTAQGANTADLTVQDMLSGVLFKIPKQQAITVDQNYNASSTNPQSGTAVDQAVSGKISATDYATQTTGGTIKAWTTTDGSDTILHLATQ